MESTTKNRQSPEVLRQLIARAYGPDLVPDLSPEGDAFAHEMTEGWFNVAYRIRLRDGRDVVLKIAPPADVTVLTRESGMMRAELEAMRLVTEHTSVPVPRIDHVDLSHEIVDADLLLHGVHRRRQLRLHGIRGRPLSRRDRIRQPSAGRTQPRDQHDRRAALRAAAGRRVRDVARGVHRDVRRHPPRRGAGRDRRPSRGPCCAATSASGATPSLRRRHPPRAATAASAPTTPTSRTSAAGRRSRSSLR